MTSWVGTYQSWSEYHGNLLIIILVTMQQYVNALGIQNVVAYCTVHYCTLIWSGGLLFKTEQTGCL